MRAALPNAFTQLTNSQQCLAHQLLCLLHLQVRVRENAEAVAFYRGEDDERALLAARLRAAVRLDRDSDARALRASNPTQPRTPNQTLRPARIG